LITSTALTLVIVPAAFTFIDDVERWLAPRFGRVLTAQPPPAGAPAQPRPVN
jgi:hydrophobic/amphiphilic exporter-1 (mainly G- bacteria), HAE1 family